MINVRDLKKHLEDPLHICNFKKGPPLIHERFKFAYGSCSVDEKSRLIVAGGNDLSNTLSTVEYLDPDSNLGWQEGMYQYVHSRPENLIKSRQKNS